MNRKGGFFLACVVMGMIFMIGMMFIPFMKDEVTTFRTNMQCSNTSITDGAKLTCLGGDLVIPYFILVIFMLVGGILANEL